MRLLAPAALAALAALIPLVALHLRRRHREVRVPSVLLWRDVPSAPAARRAWLPPLSVLLALQALVIVLLGVALARPVLGGGGDGVTEVAVVEGGARMAAPARQEAARRATRGADRVVAARSPEDVGAALAAAAQALDGPGTVTLVRAAETPVPRVNARGVRLVDVPIGAAADQSVERLTARCAPAAPDACTVRASVRNGARAARTDTVALTVDGRAAGTRRLAVPAGGTADLAFGAPAGARVRVALRGAGDGLPGDDAASVMVPSVARTRVVLVSDRPASAPLARAFAAVPGVALRRVAPGATIGAAELVVLDRRPLSEAPRGARVLAVAPPEGRAVADATPVGSDPASPLVEDVSLAGLTVDRGAARVPALPRGVVAVVRGVDGPLLAAGDRLAVLTFDPERSSLPTLVAFPTLIANVVRWAQGERTEVRGGAESVVPMRAPDASDAGGAERWRWFVVAALLALLVEAALARPAAAGLALRGGMIVVLVAALAVGGRNAPDVVVVDVSASVGRGAEVPECVAPCRRIEVAERAAAGEGGDVGSRAVTDLAAGLRAAGARVEDGGRVVVVSDGAATGGDAAAEADALRARDVQVQMVTVPGARRARDVALTRLEAPPAVRTGTGLSLLVTVDAPARTRATLTLTRDGAPAGTREVTVRAGATPLVLDERATAPGVHRYRVAVSAPDDPERANDALEAVVEVAEEPRVSILGDAGRLPAQLRAAGARVTTGALDPSADAVVLADVPPPSSATARALTAAVRERGTGLLVLGGERSLSLGGYAGTQLDALLPTRSLTPRAARRRALALELVVDRSSSMADIAGGGTRTKLELAQAAARSALEAVARDEGAFGLVAFDAAARELVPLARVERGASAEAAARRIDALDVGGGTSVGAGLRAGIARLAAVAAPRRHLVLVSDGVSEPVDVAALTRAARRARVTVSTVALGSGADRALLRRLAGATGGRSTDVPDAQRLPRIIAGEARRVTPGVAARGTLPVRAGAASPILAGLGGGALAPVRGLVATELRAGAAAPLTATVDGRTVPVLAQGQAGLGRTATWAPGAGGWAGRWAGTDVLPSAVAWVARAPVLSPTAPTLRPDGRALVIDPLARGGSALELATIAGTAGGARVTFTETAPSRYEAALPRATRGARTLTVTTSIDGGAPQPVALPYAADLAPPGVVPNRLAAVAPEMPDAQHPLWPWLLGAAIAALLVTVAADRRAGRRGR